MRGAILDAAVRRFVLVMLLLTPAGFGYVREVTSGATSVPLVRADNTAIPFFLNNLIVPGYQSPIAGSASPTITPDSNPLQAVRNALATWNAVSTANIKFLPLQPTASVINANDFQATIAFGSTVSDLSLVGPALAVTVDSYVLGPSNLVNGSLVACSSNCKYPVGGDITDSDIILNPDFTFTTTGTAGAHDLQAVLTHELGHSLSANHTGLLGGTMYPYINGTIPRYLSTDDLAFVNSVYPLPSAPAPFGTISGTIMTTQSVPIAYGLITMIDTTGGSTVGGLTNPDGTFSVRVPPATYIVYVEPYNSVLQLGPGNFYLTTAQAAMVSSFQAAMYGGAASPTQVNVTANNTATVNISVTAGASPLQMQYYAIGGAGKSGDVSGVKSLGPIQVASGAAVNTIDFTFIGPGLDATLTDANFRVYGQGISVHPGSVRVDQNAIFQQGPLIRATLDIPARQTDTLASIFISTASGTLSLSAIFTVTPPTPTFAVSGVISNAAYTGIPFEVSPGGIYSIYYANSPSLGPANPVLDGGYDAYGFLPTVLAGVSVTFDGIAAPMFYAAVGQLDFQVPFELAKNLETGVVTKTQVVVNYLGSASAPVAVPVVPSQPTFYSIGTAGAVLAINPDGTLNSAQNPAARGTFVTIYGDGVGGVSYPIVTGQGAPGLPSSSYTGSYTYSIGASPPAPASFGGWSPGSVGLAQWNLQIPSGTPSGVASVVVTDALGASSQSGATIFVK